MSDRSRMIFDLPREVQLAIRLTALKLGITTGKVLIRAVELTFPDDLRQAKEILTKKRCPRCKGNGRIDMLEHCPKCKGSGEAKTE